MANSQLARLERLHRVRNRLGTLYDQPRGELDQDIIEEYHGQLDLLVSYVESIDEFRIAEQDWKPSRMRYDSGPYALHYTGPLTGTEPMRVSLSVFQARLREAVGAIDRVLQEEAAQMEAQRKTAGDIIAERKRILATLVDAYLVDQSEFHMLKTSDTTIFHHRGLPRGFTAELSHIDALGQDGQLIVTQGSKRYERTINIPTSLLAKLSAQDREALAEPAGESRVERLAESHFFYQIFHAPVGNVAQGSSHVRQEATMGVPPGNRLDFQTALQALGLSPSEISELSDALDDDQEVAGEPAFGENAQSWVGRFSARAAESVAVGVLVEAIKQYVGN